MTDTGELIPLHATVFDKPPVPSADPGPASTLIWVPIGQLFIDPKYQRPVGRDGARNIRRIVENFSWSLFSPLVVCARPQGRFAVVDGQHRATAALVRGDIAELPCCVIPGDDRDEARAFAAINGQVTGVMRTQIFHARLAAGDPEALAVQEACEAAGVTVLRVPGAAYAKGETMAIGTIEQGLAQYGRETLITALMCITDTCDGNAGLLRAPLIKALCDILDLHHDWRDAGEPLFEAIDEMQIRRIYRQADIRRGREGGGMRKHLAAILAEGLARAFGTVAA